MKVKYIIDAAGIPAGHIKSLPDSLAAILIEGGIVEPFLEPSRAQADKVITPAVNAAKNAPKRAKNKKK